MAAGEIRRAIVGRIPDSLRNCSNKEYFSTGGFNEGINGSGYNYNPMGVPHSTTTLDSSHPVAMSTGSVPGSGPPPGSLPAPSVPPNPHSQPHSTLQDTPNHLAPKPESSEVH